MSFHIISTERRVEMQVTYPLRFSVDRALVSIVDALFVFDFGPLNQISAKNQQISAGSNFVVSSRADGRSRN